jgi:hypothetical protein
MGFRDGVAPGELCGEHFALKVCETLVVGFPSGSGQESHRRRAKLNYPQHCLAAFTVFAGD